MLAKIKKGKFIITASTAVLCLTLALNFNKDTFNIFLFDTLESVNSYDPGYSSLKEFLGLNNLVSLGDSNAQIITGLAKKFLIIGLPKLPNILFAKIAGNDNRPKIDDINLDIKFENFQTILEDRQQGLQDGILINPRTVNARITYLGRSYKAKIRLKGDLSDHWRSNLRMSFRVTLKGDETILGMRRFSMHSPGSRQYPHEQVYQDLIDDLDGLSVPHKLLRVSVNGVNWGVMNVEEHMSKELLEKQELKESIIFKFSDEQLWQYQKKNSNIYEHYKLSDPQLYSSIYQSGKYLGYRIYREQYSYILNSYAKNKIYELISVEPALKAIILSGIWNNQHALNFVNSKFYLNPYTLKLDTITTDQGPILKIKQPYAFVKNLDGFYLDFLFHMVEEGNVERLTSDILLMKERLLNLYSYHRSYFPFDEPINNSVIDLNFLKIEENNANFLRELKSERYKTSAQKVAPPSTEQLISMPAHVKVQHYDNGEVWVSNLLPIPVNVKAISHLSKSIKFEDSELLPSISSIETKIFKTPFLNIQDELIEVYTETQGVKKKNINDMTLIADVFNPLNKFSDLEKYSFIKKSKNGYIVNSGSWIISEPIVISGDLHIKQGTKLIFEKDSYLIIQGSIRSLGTKQDKVEFLPASDTWKGLYVLGGGSSSTISHTEFSSTDELRDGILQLTGGVTFYNSDINISNSSFNTANGEDALNIIKSEFEISNVVVDGAFSDGIDFDFSHGVMKNSLFKNVGGDAVDVSGGDVELLEMLIKDVRDKGISAGEGSKVKVSLSEIKDIGVGIASKDGSEVYVNATFIKDSKLFDLMTYKKKNFFKSPRLIFNHDDNIFYSAARQNGTYLEVNNIEIPERKLDVDKLYESSVMSK